LRKTYLRYPGGKSNAIKNIDKYLPDNFIEYREPMVGGGSMFLHIKKKYPDKTFWINDVYTNLYLFWIAARDNNEKLVETLLKLKMDTTEETSRSKFVEIKETISAQDNFTRAVYFYYLNKCSFSGLTESGTCSPQAWVQNFSIPSIKSLADLKFLLKDVKITNLDYIDLLNHNGNDVFIYLDPPYDIGKENMLYGKNGETHRNFNHIKFSEDAYKCTHKVMISYNDSTILRERYKDFLKMYILDFRYTMRLIGKNSPKKTELLVCNYE
jgi:DNA adenine methylase